VQYVIDSSEAVPTLPGMKTPKGRHVSEQGKAEILRRRQLQPPQPMQTIANKLGLTKAQVQYVYAVARHNDAQQSTGTQGAVGVQRQEAEPPPRPIVQLQDWDAVRQRGWNAGDRFSVVIDGQQAFFEVARHLQHGDDLDKEDFRPIIMGG
jgi:hypothetical protein